MFSTIMVPVDLAHAATVEKAINIAVGIGKSNHADIYCFIHTMALFNIRETINGM